MPTKNDSSNVPQFFKNWKIEDCLNSIKKFFSENDGYCTRRRYRETTGVADQTWQRYFGTFQEFRNQARLNTDPTEHKVLKDIAKHTNADAHRKLNERHDWGEAYARSNSKRFKTILFASDLHDIDIDQFYLRVLIDTAKRVQPDIISLVGDVFDLYEFGKYTLDPREFDPAKRINFVHNDILNPLRVACPDAQIDLIEGNHEARLLRMISSEAPALRMLLSDVHGMSMPDLLGLKKYEVNYVSRADLGAFSDRDLKEEIKKNYKIYYDCVLAHHFPQGKDYGMAGISGHNHKHIVWPCYNPMFGNFEWHQLGAGQKRLVSYCDADNWSNGFALCNVDTQTKRTSFDYIDTTHNFAVSGGKWYYRLANEQI